MTSEKSGRKINIPWQAEEASSQMVLLWTAELQGDFWSNQGKIAFCQMSQPAISRQASDKLKGWGGGGCGVLPYSRPTWEAPPKKGAIFHTRIMWQGSEI